MEVANFEEFCNSLCTLLGLPPPSLEPDANGIVGFTVTYRDTRIGFMEVERANGAGLGMIVEFGPPPLENELNALRTLLDANFLLLGAGAPSFARNPLIGEITLNYSYLLSEVDVHGVCRSISAAADAVANWKENPMSEAALLDEALGAAAPPVRAMPEMPAAAERSSGSTTAIV